MENRQQYSESDPRHHTIKVKGMLDDLIAHVREDVGKVDEPQAKAMFETTAEVAEGLKRTYEHYEQRAEAAFRP